MPAKEKYFVESFGRGEAGRVLTDLVPLSYGSEVCSPGHSASGLRDYYMIHYIVSGRGRFEYRGTIFLENGDPRLAYDWMAASE